MAWIRLTVSLLTLALLYQVSFLLLPVLHLLTDWILLLLTAWLIGSAITKHLLLKYLPPVDPKGRAVLITGCDHGFGYLAALRLTDLGFHVFAGCLNSQADGARKLQQEVRQKERLTLLQLDVTKQEEIDAAARVVREKVEKRDQGIKELYAVINNAGIMLASLIEAATLQDYERQWAVNTLGPVRVTRALLPLLRRSSSSGISGGGRVITISSIVARIALPSLIPYSMSKAATSKFVEGLQVELSRFGIKSISIEPWAVRTNLVIGKHLVQGLLDNYAAAAEEVRAAYGSGFASHSAKTTAILQDFPLNTTESMVIRDIVDALTSPEPELVYRVVRPELAWVFWLTDDYLPWHVTNCLRWASIKALGLAAAFK